MDTRVKFRVTLLAFDRGVRGRLKPLILLEELSSRARDLVRRVFREPADPPHVSVALGEEQPRELEKISEPLVNDAANDVETEFLIVVDSHVAETDHLPQPHGE